MRTTTTTPGVPPPYGLPPRRQSVVSQRWTAARSISRSTNDGSFHLHLLPASFPLTALWIFLSLSLSPSPSPYLSLTYYLCLSFSLLLSFFFCASLSFFFSVHSVLPHFLAPYLLYVFSSACSTLPSFRLLMFFLRFLFHPPTPFFLPTLFHSLPFLFLLIYLSFNLPVSLSLSFAFGTRIRTRNTVRVSSGRDTLCRGSHTLRRVYRAIIRISPTYSRDNCQRNFQLAVVEERFAY